MKEKVAKDEETLKLKAETPAERFKRISEVRVNNTLNDLRKLATMGRAPGYEYTGEDIEKIFSAIDKAVVKAKLSFEKDFNAEFHL